MTIRVVRLGEARGHGEGTAHRHRAPPAARCAQGAFAAEDWYDVWYPNLAPSVATMKLAQQADHPGEWRAFTGNIGPRWPRPRAAARSICSPRCRSTPNFSVGCYCADEAHCHRSVLRELLAARGALIDPGRDR